MTNQLQLFSWDEDKETQNEKKHGITFKEASTVFEDENAILIHDEDHSNDEDRFVIIGYSKKPRLLVVCHCYRESDTVIRLISARTASKNEVAIYER